MAPHEHDQGHTTPACFGALTQNCFATEILYGHVHGGMRMTRIRLQRATALQRPRLKRANSLQTGEKTALCASAILVTVQTLIPRRFCELRAVQLSHRLVDIGIRLQHLSPTGPGPFNTLHSRRDRLCLQLAPMHHATNACFLHAMDKSITPKHIASICAARIRHVCASHPNARHTLQFLGLLASLRIRRPKSKASNRKFAVAPS